MLCHGTHTLNGKVDFTVASLSVQAMGTEWSQRGIVFIPARPESNYKLDMAGASPDGGSAF